MIYHSIDQMAVSDVAWWGARPTTLRVKPHLILVQVSIDSLFDFYEFVVCATLDNTSFGEDKNFVSLANRAQTMGNDERGPPLHKLLE